MRKSNIYLVSILIFVISLLFVAKTNYSEFSYRGDKNYLEEEIIGLIEIPKINLIKEFYKKDSINNNIDKNLMIIGDMPSEKGQFIVAGHSGSSTIAYFNDLYKLEYGDKINIYYENNNYVYTIFEIYDINKTGKLYLKENEKGIIVLVTCRIGTDKQTIYKGIIQNT